MTVTLKPELRDKSRKSIARRLRAGGRIPAVVYGPNVPSTPISISEKELAQALRHRGGHLLEMDIPDAGTHPVLLAEVQRDPLTGRVLHVDFRQVNLNEPIRAEVPVVLVGESEAVRAGGVLSQLLDTVEVRCLPDRLPEEIRVDVSKLEIGDKLTVGELSVPEGVEVLDEPDAVVVTVLAARAEAEGGPEAEQAEAKAQA